MACQLYQEIAIDMRVITIIKFAPKLHSMLGKPRAEDTRSWIVCLKNMKPSRTTNEGNGGELVTRKVQ
jgi:hypothetical protein